MITRTILSAFFVCLMVAVLTIFYGWTLLKFLLWDHKAFTRVDYKEWNPIDALELAVLAPWERV